LGLGEVLQLFALMKASLHIPSLIKIVGAKSRAVIWCWPWPGQSFLVSGLVGIREHVFVPSNIFLCFEMGPPVRQEEGLVFCDYFEQSSNLLLAFTGLRCDDTAHTFHIGLMFQPSILVAVLLYLK
jgi:hypothetical protein